MNTQAIQISTNDSPVFYNPSFCAAPEMNRLQRLANSDEQEVLEFLKIRPVQTVVMTSFIKDNRIEGACNRGRFYGYRGENGNLEGVALIGHTTLVESRTENSLAAFAFIARQSETPIHIMMSDGETIETFWRHYAGDFRKPRMICAELLFELQFPFPVQDCAWEIRGAKSGELEQIAEAHAEVAFAESGVDPLIKDRVGFLERCLKRIEKQRTFVVFHDGKLVFKADIAAESFDVIYLEGIYVAPEFRGRNVGSSCIAKLSLSLLNRARHICLLSNVGFKGAHRSYLKAGYKNTDCYQTIFV